MTGFVFAPIPTVKTAEILDDLYIPLAACTAVIIAIPGATNVTVDPEIVATAALLLKYVYVPALLEVGAANVNAGLLIILLMFAQLLSVGKAELAVPTVIIAVVVEAVKLPLAAWLIVIMEVPAPPTVKVFPEIVATLVVPLLYVIAPEELVSALSVIVPSPTVAA